MSSAYCPCRAKTFSNGRVFLAHMTVPKAVRFGNRFSAVLTFANIAIWERYPGFPKVLKMFLFSSVRVDRVSHFEFSYSHNDLQVLDQLPIFLREYIEVAHDIAWRGNDRIVKM